MSIDKSWPASSAQYRLWAEWRLKRRVPELDDDEL